EAGDVGLHDDVEQHGGDIGMTAHQLAAFGCGVGREDFQRRAVQIVVAQRKTRAFMHGGIVVDDGDLPFAGGRVLRSYSGIVDQVEDIVLFGHCWVPSATVSGIMGVPRATLGMIMRHVVPCPSLDSSIMRPPSCWVTRLYTICRPRPVPPWLRRVVKNGSNACLCTSGVMPAPSSAKLISTTSWPRGRAEIEIVPA